MKISLLGAGAWGTALAILFANSGHSVKLWCRNQQLAQQMQNQRINNKLLPDFILPKNIAVTANFDDLFVDNFADLILIATPTAALRSNLELIKSKISTQIPILWACKGFETQSSLLPHQIVSEIFDNPNYPMAVLSGPSFAQEVAQSQPTAVSLAANDINLAQNLANALHSENFRIYSNDDLIGVEVGGACKNVLAIATGICDGLNFKFNTRAALITRGLAEIARLGVTMGGKHQTFLGLSGIGDILLTCTGDLSRNRQVGLQLAQGKTLSKILQDLGHVAEGVFTAKEMFNLSQKYNVEVPICQSVMAAFEKSGDANNIKDIAKKLLMRTIKAE